MSTRPTYDVHIERTHDGWWYIAVPAVPMAMTQARRLDQVQEMARDVVALATDSDPGSFDLTPRPVVIPDGALDLLNAARDARARSSVAEQEARDATTRAVVGLSAMGFPMRDIGALLGVTHQRVAQLIHGASAVRIGATTAAAPETTSKDVRSALAMSRAAKESWLGRGVQVARRTARDQSEAGADGERSRQRDQAAQAAGGRAVSPRRRDAEGSRDP